MPDPIRLVPFVPGGSDFAKSRELPTRFSGFRLKPPTDFPWGREVHFIDLAGVCWHVGTP
jgi:hypothetical protein